MNLFRRVTIGPGSQKLNIGTKNKRQTGYSIRGEVTLTNQIGYRLLRHAENAGSFDLRNIVAKCFIAFG